MVLENLVKGVKYVAGGLALGASMLFGGAVMSGCDENNAKTEATHDVSNFTAISGNHEIHLSWMHPNYLDYPGVRILRGEESYPTGPNDGTLVYEGSGNRYTDAGLSDHVCYCYKIFSFSYTDPLMFFSEQIASAIPFDAIAPGNVSNIVVTPQVGAIKLTWTNPPDTDLAGVHIWRRTSLDEHMGPVVYNALGETFTDTDVIDDVTYYYGFFTYDEVPNWSRELIVSGTTIDMTPPDEVAFVGVSFQDGVANISWTNPDDADFVGVQVVRKLGSPSISITDGDYIYDGNGESCSDPNIPNDDGVYYYTVFTYDDMSNFSSGSNGFITKDSLVGIGWIGGGQDGWRTDLGATESSADKSFQHTTGVFVDSSGNIYVADSYNCRVYKWDSSGNAIGWIGGGTNGWKTGPAPSAGNDYQSFRNPADVSVDASGNIYVADITNNRISKWDANGNALGWFGQGSNGWKTSPGVFVSNGNPDYQSFNSPHRVFVTVNGDIYVTDQYNHRVCKWDTNANAIGWIGGGSNGWKIGDAPTSGSSDYQSFNYPKGLSLYNGFIFVADTSNNRISKWDLNGNAIGWIGGGSNGWKTSTGTALDNINPDGFYWPRDVYVKNGFIYVADGQNNRMCKWNLSGEIIGVGGGDAQTWKSSLSFNQNIWDGFLFMPYGIYVDQNNCIYVAEFHNHRISKWQD